MDVELETYIQQKLVELDHQKDMQEVVYRGKLSFGVDAKTYSHLPAWNNLVKQKKTMVRLLWAGSFITTLAIIAFTGDYFNELMQSWWKGSLHLIIASAFLSLFYVAGAFYSLFYQFRKAEREVRKLIYHDILFQLQKVEKMEKAAA